MPSQLKNIDDDQRNVILLFIRTEPPDLLNNRTNQGLRRKLAIPTQRSNQTLLSKFFSAIVRRFSYAIRVKHEYISGKELPFFKRAENWEAGADATHGTGGPLCTSKTADMPLLCHAAIEAGQQIGMQYRADVNDLPPEFAL